MIRLRLVTALCHLNDFAISAATCSSRGCNDLGTMALNLIKRCGRAKTAPISEVLHRFRLKCCAFTHLMSFLSSSSCPDPYHDVFNTKRLDENY